MNTNNLIKLIDERFKTIDGEVLNMDNSPELFSNFTENDIPTLKRLKYHSDYRVKTRAGELNLSKLAILKN